MLTGSKQWQLPVAAICVGSLRAQIQWQMWHDAILAETNDTWSGLCSMQQMGSSRGLTLCTYPQHMLTAATVALLKSIVLRSAKETKGMHIHTP